MLAVAAPGGLCVLDFTDRRGLAAHLAQLAARGRIMLADDPAPGPVPPGPAHALLDAAHAAVSAYFAGDCPAVAALGLAAPSNATPFRLRAWAYLRTIPPHPPRPPHPPYPPHPAHPPHPARTSGPQAHTRSYLEQATAMGDPRACRAVGGANAANFLALAIPCHRVIGSAGDMVGYGGSPSRKQWLLDHERASCGPS